MVLLRHFRDWIAMYSYTHALLRTCGSLSWLRSGADTKGGAKKGKLPGFYFREHTLGRLESPRSQGVQPLPREEIADHLKCRSIQKSS